ncbi:MAG TPA: hypothetical protein VGP13_01940, partial [Candidatus Paceibacterota bacterium]|nr:hypothetical protein [Candidatus Paceibacterota bacterium]
MDILTALVGVLILLALGIIAMLYRMQKGSSEAPQDTQSMMLLQNQLAELTRAMDSKLGEGNKTMTEFMTGQQGQARELMSTISKQVQDQLLEVVKGVAETKESTKQVLTVAE